MTVPGFFLPIPELIGKAEKLRKREGNRLIYLSGWHEASLEEKIQLEGRRKRMKERQTILRRS